MKEVNTMTVVLTRKECLQRLEELGYDGPTSYLMPELRDIVKREERKARMAHARKAKQSKRSHAA